MLKPKEIEKLPENLIELYSQLEQDILKDMARRISTYDYYIPAAQWQYQKMIELGNYNSYVQKALSAYTGKTEEEIRSLMQEAGIKTLRFDDAIYKAAGLKVPPLAASEALRNIINTGIKNTNGLFENLTKTTARTSTKQLENALDRAYMQVVSGAFDSNTAIRSAIKDLARQGIQSVAYPSGHTDSIETAVRRAVTTGVNQTALKLQEARAEEMGWDLVETTAHGGARPSHTEWQGHIFSRSGKSGKYPEFESSTGYGTGEGLGGWNCRHSFFPFYEGMPRTYSEQQLKEYKEKKYEYNGQRLTEYEVSQIQRYHERQIRRWKRQEATGVDVEQAKAKIAQWQAKQREFISQTGLKRQYDREQIGKVRGVAGLKAGGGVSGENIGKAKFAGKIDITNKALIESKLREIENRIVQEPVENAFVILKNGKMYEFTGSNIAVHPEILGEALQGAIVTHNHPIDVTSFSFSQEDIELMALYQIEELRGIDWKYAYKINNNGAEYNKVMEAYYEATIEAQNITLMIEFEDKCLHNINTLLSDKVPLSYERWEYK